ncbi:MAG: aminotransferase class V-fold PLP-dependent enzyme [Armatimonadota bacterium]|nr:aminotransferase class V-fold PLP-dependent enzyme [Armatimonadota bacterium]MDR7451914.1 aminotransferase class V-fold PLP-dependent enzyme [Armatimonadota bacterium]MDR7466596.1 aminotransferase class V-fold PLP-dependent enzyme [Armatimonadota bacterium]MDR7495082.1 aminotransferase class V-fold PLP-dependent enzyme [Armatimonadota bacterium]MDR7500327.1 aminotransferase class V-fold PLP-dependent enzyme [Armatimonadota bacterium]
MAHPTTEPRSWEAWREEFPIFTRRLYYNTCSLCALARPVAAAVRAFLDQWEEWGASAWYGPWLAEIDALRAAFARLIGAAADEVAIFPSITAALTAVASAYDYRARPKVVLSDREFPTTVYQWLAKADRGVDVHLLRSPDPLTVPVDLYARAVDGRTQLVVASHVYFTSGAIQDLGALAAVAHAQGAHLLVDAYQSVGQLPTDVRATGVDFLVSGGLKWLLGGPGVAYLYARREVAASMRPADVGWFAHRNQFAFDVHRFEYADGARRFEGGTPAVGAVYAARAGMAIVEEIGVARLRERQVALLDHLVEAARAHGLHPRVPARLRDLAGIVTIPREDPAAVVAALRERQVVVDYRPGVVRLSPYFYNTPEDGERVVREIAALERRGIR